MMTRIEKYKDLRDQIEKEKKESEKTVDEIFDDMDKCINDLYIAAEVLIKKAKEGSKE